MMRRQMYVYASLLFILTATSISGCDLGTQESKKAKLLTEGKAYFDKGQYAEAVISFKNLTQIDPNSAEAHYRLALAHQKLGSTDQLEAAFGEFLRAVELDKNNLDAQLKLGELFLLGREPVKAREHADIVLVSTPQSTEGLILRGRSLINEQRYDEGVAELKKAIELDPHNMPIYIDLARAYFAAKDPASAEATLNRALTVNPNSTEILIALGDFRATTGKPDQAEIIYKEAIDTAPNNADTYIRLADLYQRYKRFADAEATLQKLATVKATDEASHVRLGDFYTTIGKPDKALSSYQRATEVNPSSSAARDKVISQYLNMGNLDEATARTKAILDKNAKDLSGRFFDARIRLAKGTTTEAIAILQSVIKDEPQFAGAHHFLGVAFLKEGKLAQARSSLAEAVRLAPQASESRLLLAQVHMAERTPDLALEQTQAVIQFNPQNVQAIVLAGNAYLMKGDLPKSKQAFEALTKALPNEPVGPYGLGRVARAEKNDAKALTYFEEALAKQPIAVDPLNQIVTIKLAQGKPNEARDRVLKQIDLAPKNAYFYDLLGQLWMKAKDPGQAVTAFKKALELDPSLAPAYVHLGQAYQLAGKTEQAVREYEAILAKDPKLINAHVLLGAMYAGQKDYSTAQRHYEQALKLDPKFTPAANNLAWILTEQGGNLDVALAHAQTARESSPQDPNVADTLGWVYYKKGAYLLAANLLREAAAKLPNEAVVHYHLGMALFKNGDAAGAKQSLQTALKLKADFPGADEAKKTLAAI